MSTRFDPAKVEPELWRRLGEALRARGLVPATLRDAERMLPGRHDALRLPLVLRALTRQASAAASLARLFVYDDALARTEADEALGAELVSALVTRGGLTGVYVAEGDVARLRWLRIGRANGGSVEVLSGLASDDAVIVDPKGLADGRKVQVAS